MIVPSLHCALTQSTSLWARKRFAKNGSWLDPIGIRIEKKQLYKRNFIASLSNGLGKTKSYLLFLDDHDAQPSLLITI